MSSVNYTEFQPAMFFFTGIPGLEGIYVWISIPLCLIYVISILGNSVILFVIKRDSKLHEPMYIFLSMLAVTDLGLLLSTMPTTLGVFMFNSREISHDACFVQVFFIHSFTFAESSMLLSMAFDRFIAICNPLRYGSILTLPRIVKMGLISLLRGFVPIFPFPFLLNQYQYCEAKVLFHSFCLHQEVMRLACSDIRVNILYGLFVTVSSVGLDILLVLLSYMMILKTVLSITCHAKRLKALNTCISHICAVLLFYMPGIALSVIYRYGNTASPLILIVMGKVHLLIPPLMNPIVYSVKTKLIRVRIIRMFTK